MDLGGQLVVAVGDPTPDANGNWQDTTPRVTLSITPGFVRWVNGNFELAQSGSVKLGVNGEFTIAGKFTIDAQNVTVEVKRDNGDTYLLLNGTITLPQLGGASVQMGDGGEGGGLKIDLSTGQWMLDGWRIVLPRFDFKAVSFDSLSIGFDRKSPTDFELLLAGGVEILDTDLQAKFDFEVKDGKFIIHDFGIAARGLSPGIAIGDTGAFITDLGVEGDNLDAGNKQIDVELAPSSAARSTSAARRWTW